jgi:hypothetical protein
MNNLYGVAARFHDAPSILHAARSARASGFRELEAYSPIPVEFLSEYLSSQKDHVALISLIGGLVSGSLGYFMQWYASVIDYPINVAGRPLHSWPSFIPVTFELTVLGAALSAGLGMLLLNRLPRVSHPMFGVVGFERASTDAFFLCIRSNDPKFMRDGPEDVRRFLLGFDPTAVTDVPVEEGA